MSTAASMDATTPPPEAGSSLSPPPPGGESSKLGPPPSSSVGENSPPSPPPSPSPPPPSPQSPPPPAPSPPPHSKSPPHSEPPKSSPSPSPPPPIPSPPHSSPVSPPPAVFIPPPTSGHASPPPPPTLTTPPPTAVSLSPPAVILSPSPPAAESLPPPTAPATNVPPISPGLIPPPPADLPLTPPVSTSPPVHGGSPAGHSTSTSSNAKSSNLSGTPTANGNDAGGTTSTKVVAGGVVAAAVLLGLIAIFFVVRIKRKRQKPYASHNMVPPTSYTVNTAGYYSGQANHSYGSHPPHFGAGGDSLGSQRGNLYMGGDPESGVIGGSKSIYAYDEVMEMTSGFARQNIIGEGGFGCVYKGRMLDGREVAVKQLKAGSGQGDREFKAEVEIISRVHHRHLVSLVGYSMSDHQLMLIYEFVPNKTLEHHLHEKGLQALDWPKRLKIAIGSAKGLAYLHEDCHPKIIHRDIKSANILLDNDFEAQVADFGLARLNDTTQTHVSTRVMGTFGYLAPEYASSGKLTDRSDVFSFGVVLLELITGRKPVDPTQPLGDESLVEWARPLLVRAVETGDISELVDPRLEKNYVESEMLRMVDTAAGCVRHSAPKRPRMVQVVRALDSENEMSDLSNGVKYGQSTVYDSGQYNQEIMNFRRMALGSKEGAEFNTYSGEYSSRDASQGLSSSGYTSGESETRAMNRARR